MLDKTLQPVTVMFIQVGDARFSRWEKQDHSVLCCDEKARLVEEHHRAAIAYSQALRALNQQKKILSAPEYQRLRKTVDEKAAESEKARLALQRHQAEHGC